VANTLTLIPPEAIGYSRSLDALVARLISDIVTHQR
jgi:hypothetical protein